MEKREFVQQYRNLRDLVRNLTDSLRYRTPEQFKEFLSQIYVDWTTKTIKYTAEQQLVGTQTYTCDCGGEYDFRTYCGAFVCSSCGDHRGLARCFCGWSKSGSLYDEVFPHGAPEQILEVWG